MCTACAEGTVLHNGACVSPICADRCVCQYAPPPSFELNTYDLDLLPNQPAQCSSEGNVASFVNSDGILEVVRRDEIIGEEPNYIHLEIQLNNLLTLSADEMMSKWNVLSRTCSSDVDRTNICEYDLSSLPTGQVFGETIIPGKCKCGNKSCKPLLAFCNRGFGPGNKPHCNYITTDESDLYRYFAHLETNFDDISSIDHSKIAGQMWKISPSCSN
jgi:hypothetical protein